MTDMLQQPFVQAFALALVHFLWQGAILAATGAVLMRIARHSPRARHAIGVGVLAAMCAAPPATAWYVTRHVSPATGATTNSAIAQPQGATVLQAADRSLRPAAPALTDGSRNRMLPAVAPQVILALWLAGVLALSIRLAGGWWIARGLARRSVQVASAEIQSVARRVAGRLALDRMVRIVESSSITVPVMVGWISPVVVLPTAALSGLSPAQVEALLAHELAHVFRHDYLVNLLQSVVETLLFYHPAVWWMSSQVRAAREQCCDDLAIGVCDRVVYATALAELAAMTAPPRLALAAADGSLVDRVRRILGKPESPRAMRAGIVPVALLILAAAIVPAAVEPTARAQSVVNSEGVRGGVHGGIAGGVPSGISSGVQGGVQGGVPGGVEAVVPTGVLVAATAGVQSPAIEAKTQIDADMAARQAGPQDRGRISQDEIQRIRVEIEQLQKQIAEKLQQIGEANTQIDDARLKRLREQEVVTQLGNAKVALDRMKTLQEQNLVSEQMVKEAEAKLIKAQVEHETQMVDVRQKMAAAVNKNTELSDEQIAELKSRLADMAAKAATADVSKATAEDVRRTLERVQADLQAKAQTGWTVRDRQLSPEAAALRDRLPRDGTLLADEAVMSIIKETGRLSTDGERADVLIAVAERQTLTPNMVSAFVSVVNGIKSEDERARVFRTPVRLRSNRGR